LNLDAIFYSNSYSIVHSAGKIFSVESGSGSRSRERAVSNLQNTFLEISRLSPSMASAENVAHHANISKPLGTLQILSCMKFTHLYLWSLPSSESLPRAFCCTSATLFTWSSSARLRNYSPFRTYTKRTSHSLLLSPNSIAHRTHSTDVSCTLRL
jgi:hypothetical protein